MVATAGDIRMVFMAGTELNTGSGFATVEPVLVILGL